MKALNKVLIANRGEIAIRVARTCKERGLSPVAIFSEADRGALHVRHADEAYCVGPAPSSESYLNISRILQTAKACGAFAIHPGYGFLAENARFAKACEEAQIVFVGPHSKTISSMGDKIEARKIAQELGLPLISASEPLKDLASARNFAAEIGYPVLLKAKAGGGGKGMRAVWKESELQGAYEMATSEALKSFSDDTLYLEKLLVRPRHIEVQVFADAHGNVLSLGDRECSIQRRHQKVIEEAPAPHLASATHEKLAEAACRLAKHVEYRGAGTVEFLVDDQERFFFLEMNTRLQVEHPVTEWITGLDLVAWQLDVAEGKALPLAQSEISLRGHSLEVRLYAEDTDHHFFPSPGTVRALNWPSGPGVRVDAGIELGTKVSVYYDPLLAKITVWAEDRNLAVARLTRALAETNVRGMKTNLSFLQRLILHPDFVRGRLTTTFIQEKGPFSGAPIEAPALHAALAAAHLLSEKPGHRFSREEPSPWWLAGLPRSSKERTP